MFMHRLVIVAVVAVFASAAQADTIFVDDDNCPGPGSGTERDPYCLIQTAIDAAVDTDEIIVAPGTYLETINFLGKAITVRSTDPNDPAVVVSTIIDGNGGGSVVTCATSEGPGSVLSGFVITGGSGTVVGSTAVGGGMFNSGSSPTVTNCSFSANRLFESAGSAFGGGMYNTSSSPTVTNCSFTGNWVSAPEGHVSYAGGMYNINSNPTVTNCSFTGNRAGNLGGGMFNFASAIPTVTNCPFSGNSAAFGGGMFNDGDSLMIADSEFCANLPEHISGGYTDDGGNEFNAGCPPPAPECPGDLDGNGNVGATDLLALLVNWGLCP